MLHAVEYDALEPEAPLLALVAIQFHHADVAIEVDVAHRDRIVRGQPAPIDEIAQRPTVNRSQKATRFEARIVGGAAGRD